MSDILEKVDSILGSVELPERHTFFQLKNFVIGKEYTVQGQLWQIVRELRSRRDSVESLQLQLEDSEDNLELIDIGIESYKEPDGFGFDSPRTALRIREMKVLIRKKEREKRSLLKAMEKLKSKIKYLTEEIQYLVGAFVTLSKVQEAKPLDDITAQKEYWNEKLSEELNLRLLLKTHIDTDFVRTILSLDEDAPVKQSMLAILKKIQQNSIEERNRQEIGRLSGK